MSRNSIKFYREKVDYHKYQFQINKYINKIVHEFTKVYKGITNYRVREVFWDLVDLKIEYDRLNWYHVFANFFGKLVVFEILYEEKKISKNHIKIRNDWTKYIANLLIPYEPQIPKKFFSELILNMPVPNYDSVLELYEEGIILFNENLKETLFSNSISPHEKILKFKSNFLNLFEVFLSKCTFIDHELSKYGEILHQSSLHKIFQLNNSNKRTPPKLARNALLILNHIRNAISHSSKAGIVYTKKNEIRVRDFDSKGKLTFEHFFTFEELYGCYYLLLTFLMEFELMALMLALHRSIRELNINYNQKFKCNKCGYERIVFVHPEKNFVVCDKCKTYYYLINRNSPEK